MTRKRKKFSELYGDARTDYRCKRDKKKIKACLKCQEQFESEGIYNWLCLACKNEIREMSSCLV